MHSIQSQVGKAKSVQEIKL